MIRDGRRVSSLIQVCAALDTPETVAREYRALYKAASATRCRDLLILTSDGRAPVQALVPKGPKVEVRDIARWLLDAG